MDRVSPTCHQSVVQTFAVEHRGARARRSAHAPSWPLLPPAQDLCILDHGGIHLLFEAEGAANPLDSPSRLFVTVRCLLPSSQSAASLHALHTAVATDPLLTSARGPAKRETRAGVVPRVCPPASLLSMCQDVDSACEVLLDGRSLEKGARTQVSYPVPSTPGRQRRRARGADPLLSRGP